MSDEIKKPKFSLAQNVFLATWCQDWPESCVITFHVKGVYANGPRGFYYTRYLDLDDELAWVREDRLFSSAAEASTSVKEYINECAEKSILAIEQFEKGRGAS